jgi:hypothetical protein
MKPFVVLLCALFAANLMLAQTPPAPAQKKGAAKEAAKKEDEIGKIEGTELARPNGKFLGLTLQEGKYKVTFYNEKKKPMKVDVLRATARWPNMHGPGNNRTVLNVAGDGTFLLGQQFVRGPYAFKLILSLIKSEDGTEAETYSVDFRG